MGELVVLAHLDVLLLLALKSGAVFHPEPAVPVDVRVEIALVVGQLDVVPFRVIKGVARHRRRIPLIPIQATLLELMIPSPAALEEEVEPLRTMSEGSLRGGGFIPLSFKLHFQTHQINLMK